MRVANATFIYKYIILIMKTVIITILISSISTGAFGQGKNGIQFFEGTWEEALALAKKEHKIIFVDAYASWCGPCKRMAKTVFVDETVGKFYNRHFINVKMDMEKGQGPKFAQKYGVSSYPTLFYIDEAAKIINLSKGAKNTEQFVALGKATLNKYDKSKDYEREYEAGNRAPEFLRAYAYALLMSNKNTLKIANEYLRTQEQLDSEENLDFIFDFVTQADSRIFDLLLKYKTALVERQTEETYYKRIEEVCDATIKKAATYKSTDLLREVKRQMKLANSKYAKEYAMLADIRFHFLSKDDSKVVIATDKYLKKYAKKQAVTAFEQADFLFKQVPTPESRAVAETWAKKAYELQPNQKYGKLYLAILRKNGKHKMANVLKKEIATLPETAPSYPPQS